MWRALPVALALFGWPVVAVSGCFAGAIGEKCTNEWECDYGLKCLEIGGAASGICAVGCHDTPCDDGRCIVTSFGFLCLRECTGTSLCDPMHACRPVDGGPNVCWPNYSGEFSVASEPPPASEPEEEDAGTTAPDGSLQWVAIPSGTFTMGCSAKDLDCKTDEKPAHPVVVAAFEMTSTEITETQYEAAMGENPSLFAPTTGCSDCPVVMVPRDEATAFCSTLGGRLPTEAEWEYAARGGTSTKYVCGSSQACLDSIAWYEENSKSNQHPVGKKSPNGYGLFDMFGNVSEWVQDCYHYDYVGTTSSSFPAWTSNCDGDQVSRGGGYWDAPTNLRASSKFMQWAGMSLPGVGFRCVRAKF